MIKIIDPPSGWRYGFPKELTKREDQTLSDWLVENGYPEQDIELALKWSRYWEEDDKDS